MRGVTEHGKVGIAVLAAVVRYEFRDPLGDPETDPALALVPGLRG